jgi:hypothetical protein
VKSENASIDHVGDTEIEPNALLRRVIIALLTHRPVAVMIKFRPRGGARHRKTDRRPYSRLEGVLCCIHREEGDRIRPEGEDKT